MSKLLFGDKKKTTYVDEYFRTDFKLFYPFKLLFVLKSTAMFLDNNFFDTFFDTFWFLWKNSETTHEVSRMTLTSKWHA